MSLSLPEPAAQAGVRLAPWEPSRASRLLKPILRGLVGVLIPIAILLWWGWAAETGHINVRIYSSPQLVLRRAYDLYAAGTLWEHLAISIQRATLGLAIGSTAGIALGVASGFFRPVERLIDPSIQLFRSMPLSSLLPLFVVWFGFGELPKVLVIVLATAPQLYVDTFTGLRNVDKKLLEVAQIFRLGKFQTIFGIILPAAAPFIFKGLRIASVTALILLVFAEAINAKLGLGYLASKGMAYFQTDLIFLVVFIYALLGLTADTIVRTVERLATPWRGKKGIR
ncbi:ABC transporter permease [Kaistia sp. 32K]|uniref:ABC transporter permease n=1 Tax=Kaistia sp. 32K TaxID=2795690 RepID=UPI001914F66A|nr:ABC transporter permease [Kaistia sp. 32K]BCP52245.1 ABC transporter permease [Kaistia sp. 32K]